MTPAVGQHYGDRRAVPPAAEDAAAEGRLQYVTAWIGDQLFGIPIEDVRDVFVIQSLTPVPLAPPEILGLANLRGRVVTAVSLRQQLGLPALPDPGRMIAIGIGAGSESFGVIVDRIGEVLDLAPETAAATPFHLDPRWTSLSKGVHRLDDRLLIVLNVDSVLSFSNDITVF
ncbi:chemotaxis protein CheW [Chelatococcus sp. GCM10030263]|uniref:chemotaxis protein CheW n=1 Tax=Chelatococcus sp. GCM10030263 TaxID=3273387 RepID=UPI003620BF8E